MLYELSSRLIHKCIFLRLHTRILMTWPFLAGFHKLFFLLTGKFWNLEFCLGFFRPHYCRTTQVCFYCLLLSCTFAFCYVLSPALHVLPASTASCLGVLISVAFHFYFTSLLLSCSCPPCFPALLNLPAAQLYFCPSSQFYF